MIGFGIKAPTERPLRILCLGAHSDDIEIGCGGSILQLCGRHAGTEVRWVVLSAQGPRVDEAEAGAASFLEGAGSSEVLVQDFRDGFFPQQTGEIKSFLESLASGPSPDLIFTHCRHDRHQDHKLISDLTWNTWRDHLVLEYEVPKYDGDFGIPNCFVPLSRAEALDKVARLGVFQSQTEKTWFRDEVFVGLMALRGVECRAPEGYAEAFYGRKIVVG